MTGKSINRSQMFVDRKVQGALLWRTTVYWCYAMLTIMASIISWRILVQGVAQPINFHLSDVVTNLAPMILGAACMLPILLFDMARLTNRFVGPLYRLRNELRRLARGEKVQKIHFRDDDFWHEIAEEFNAVVARVETLEEHQHGALSVATPTGADD